MKKILLLALHLVFFISFSFAQCDFSSEPPCIISGINGTEHVILNGEYNRIGKFGDVTIGMYDNYVSLCINDVFREFAITTLEDASENNDCLVGIIGLQRVPETYEISFDYKTIEFRSSLEIINGEPKFTRVITWRAIQK